MANPYESPKVESEFQPTASLPASPTRLQSCMGCLLFLVAPVLAWFIGTDATERFLGGDWFAGACFTVLGLVVMFPWFWLPFAVRRELRRQRQETTEQR